MTRCKEYYDLLQEVTEGCSTEQSRGSSSTKKKYIEAYLGLAATFVTRGALEASIYCNFTENAARPLWRKDVDGEAREATIDEIAERCIRGEITTNRDTERLLQKHTNNQKEVPPPPEGEFNLIYADPPWKYDTGTTTPRRVIEKHYPTMELDEIKDLLKTFSERKEFEISKDAILFLWATAPKLEEALAVMDAWGFTYRTNIVWDKERMGLGHWARIQHEHLLIGRKGNMSPPEDAKQPRSIIRERSKEHSKKPAKARSIIEHMYPHTRKLELFGRDRHEGWVVWGNEVTDIIVSEQRKLHTADDTA